LAQVKNHEAERFLRSPPANIFLFLIFGPDTGLVSERASFLMAAWRKSAGPDCETIHLEGDALAQDPLLLADEANAVGMFSAKKILHIRAGGKAFLAALEPVLNAPPQDCIIIIEAGALRRDAALRVLCTDSAGAAAVECYPDGAREIAALIDGEKSAGRLPLDRDARDMLVLLLGADRLGTRSEIEKLELYAQGQTVVTAEDVRAIVTNASALAIDDAVEAAFVGRSRDALDAAARLFATGTPADVVLSAAVRHAMLLHRIVSESESGKQVEAAAAGALPRGAPPFRVKALTDQARLWSSASLLRFLPLLRDVSFRTRVDARLSETHALRAITAIATTASRVTSRLR